MSNADLDVSRTAKGKLSIFDILLIERERTFWWVCEDSDGKEQKVWKNLNLFPAGKWNKKYVEYLLPISPYHSPTEKQRFLLLAGKCIFSRCCWNKKVQMNAQILFLVKEFPMLRSWLVSQSLWEASSDELKVCDVMYDVLYTVCQLSKKLSQT